MRPTKPVTAPAPPEPTSVDQTEAVENVQVEGEKIGNSEKA